MLKWPDNVTCCTYTQDGCAKKTKQVGKLIGSYIVSA